MNVWRLMIALLLVLLGGLIWHGRKEKVSHPLPVQAKLVYVHPVRRHAFVTGVDALGTVTPVQTVVVRTQLDAQPLQALYFHEGERVKAGQLLALIDPRPYVIAVAQAAAQRDRDQQQLKNAQVDALRYHQLMVQHAVSDQTLVTQDAQVRTDAATVAADQANLNNARLLLSYTRISSPLNGVVGIRQVDPGNLVHISDVNGIVSVVQMDPMDVMFSVPESEVPQLQGLAKPIKVQVWNQDSSQMLTEGTVISLDNQIDLTTGTLKIRAEFANAAHKLFPNQFVNVRLITLQVDSGLVIPRQAVLERNGHYLVDTVVNNRIVEQPVSVQALNRQQALINNGVYEGQLLITEGTDPLRSGMPVLARVDSSL